MPAIEVEDLNKSYGRLRVLKGVSLEIAEGESFALLGPNGAGKTTLIKIITTLIKPEGGKVRVQGIDALEEPSSVKGLFGLVSHHNYLYEELTAWENLEFYSQIYGSREEQAYALLEEVGLSQREDSLVSTFSRGMKQRLSIARALLHNPQILILDEPTTGLDLNSKRWFYSTVNKKIGEGRTVLLTTHAIEEAEKLCTRAGIMLDGSLVRAQAIDRSLEEEYFDLTEGGS